MKLFKHFIFFVLTLIISLSAHANTKVIIPFSPGGGTDAAFKHFQNYINEKYQLNLIPLYKPGAETFIGMNELSKATDNTIGITTIASLEHFQNKNKNYKFIVVGSLGTSIMSLVASNKSGFKTLTELEISLSRKNQINIGFGSPAQKKSLVLLINNNQSTVDNLIPYKGTGPLINDLIGGHIDIAFVPLSTVFSHIQNKNLILLASTSNDYKVNLLNHYKNWQINEGFILVLPENSNLENVKFWQNILINYSSDSQTIEYRKSNYINK